VSKGVRPYLLLSGSGTEKGDAVQGKVHEYLDQCGDFGSSFYHTIRSIKEIFSVVEDGCVPFAGIGDVARAAYDALVAEKSPDKDFYRRPNVTLVLHWLMPKPGRIPKSLIGCCNVERSSGMGDYSQEGKNWPCTLPLALFGF